MIACRGAATSGQVFLELIGSEGSTKQLCLDNSWDNFARGSIDHFTVRCRPLGDILKVRVALIPASGSSGKVGAWHLHALHVLRKEGSIEEPMCSFFHQDWINTGQACFLIYRLDKNYELMCFHSETEP